MNPLGVNELFEQRLNGSDHPAITDHWYWCRRHQRAEHVGWPENSTNAADVPPDDVCIRIGPFMSEREANRLSIGFEVYESWASIEQGHVLGPLGMVVE